MRIGLQASHDTVDFILLDIYAQRLVGAVISASPCLAVPPAEAPSVCPELPARHGVVLGEALIDPVPDEPSLQTSMLPKYLRGAGRGGRCVTGLQTLQTSV